MALTKKMLSAMDIPVEKIDEIMSAHLESINALRDERDSYKEELDKTQKVVKDLEKSSSELESLKSGDWENKYKTLKTEYDAFKSDTEAKATKQAKEAAYKKLLLEAGISEKRLASVLKVSDVDSIQLDKDGNVKDSEKLTESIKNEWADFIVTVSKQGAGVSNPPDNKGGAETKPTRAQELAAKYHEARYGTGKES